MNISTRVLLLIVSLIVGILSITIIIFPFSQLDFLSVDNLSYFLESIKGNYIYSLIGISLLLLCVKGILISVGKSQKVENISYLIKRTDYGEVKVSSDTIVGLVNYACEKFTGLREIGVKVDIIDGQIVIYLEGKVIPEINIPEVTEELQVKVKKHVENSTGVTVNEIKVTISNVSAPVRNIK